MMRPACHLLFQYNQRIGYRKLREPIKQKKIKREEKMAEEMINYPRRKPLLPIRWKDAPGNNPVKSLR